MLPVAIVDDDAVVQELAAAVLQSRGHEVRSFSTAEEAWAATEARPATLYLLDWQLPGMDGLELCRRIRARTGGDRCYVLVITVSNQPQDLRAVLDAGADDYLAKPLIVPLLNVRIAVAERQIEVLLRRKQAESALEAAMQELAKSRDNLAAVLGRLSLGTAMTDAEGRVEYLNEAAQRMTGKTGDAIRGRFWEELFGGSGDTVDRLRATVDRPERERGRVAGEVLAAPGRRTWFDVEMLDEPRDPSRRILVLYDTTELHVLRTQLGGKSAFEGMVGKSDAMRRVFDRIEDLGRVDSTVLIEGQTGTGKELVARAIHRRSARADRPFVAVNCAGLDDSLLSSQLFGHRRGAFTGAIADQKGLFEEADSGTIFLDEIGDVSPNVQRSLLRVLQEKEIVRLGESRPRKVDVRVLVATHRNLAVEAEAGRFRSDLLYRVRVGRILLPPLCERREDIPLLIESFLGQCRAITGKPVQEVAPDTLRELLAHCWPGNVRELRSAIEYAVIHCAGTTLRPEDLPPEIGDEPAGERLEDLPSDERGRILAALERAQGNRTRAARLLGISRATFYRKLAALGLDPGE